MPSALFAIRGPMIESYIVRIYRREPDGDEVTGVVEDAQGGTALPFRSIAELAGWLSAPTRRRRRRSRVNSTGSEETQSDNQGGTP
jgi:hypothetical protein